MNLRVWYNIWLVRLKIRSVLPTEAIRRIRVIECGEPLVVLPSDDLLSFHQERTIYGRAGVIAKLYEVEKALNKQGCRLAIFEIYRDQATQLERRNDEYECIRRQHPELKEAEIQRMLNRRVANVTTDSVGGHQTGGAVDCALCSADGRLLDMGTRYREFTPQTQTRAVGLSDEQKRNRHRLCKAMQQAGFVNYPNEWWHFAYGDSLWAAYKHRATAPYGPAILPR